VNPQDEHDAIAQLFRMHSNDVFRYARLTLGNHTEAKDVVQEVFFRAFRSWSTFRQDSNPKTWLLSIARNYISDLLRKKRRERKFMAEYEAPSIKDETVSTETIMILEQSLHELKETYREVFVLRHVEGLSIQETAKLLACSEGNIRTTDYRAIHKLRELMQSDAMEVNLYNE
jgi:RNA polymerase sigma-70 factor, ECF subfamily